MFRPPTAVALITTATLVVGLSQIDAVGNYPSLPEGPGLTLDESFNVRVGVFLVRAHRLAGLENLNPFVVSEAIYANPGHLADHPPLGRIALGISHDVVTSLFTPEVGRAEDDVCVAAGRPAAVLAFALTVLLVGWFAHRWHGPVAGFVAALALATTPRAFGHAHIASLESFIGLAYAACLLTTAQLWSQEPTKKRAALCGVLWGLALLTKIQAVLLPVPLTIWAFWHFPKKGFVALSIFGLVGLATLLIGWPWLWLDPVNHLLKYAGRTTDRIELHAFFLGERYGDRSLPVTYAPVMFLVTYPTLWLAAAARGAWSTLRQVRTEPTPAQRRNRLVLMSAAFPILFFALPNIATYDGVRLFLVAYPIFAVLTGHGAELIWAWFKERRPSVNPKIATTVLLLLSVPPLVLNSPTWLSHYTCVVGGRSGAVRLGMEQNYWADSVTRSVWSDLAESVPAGSTVAVSPVLHQFQLPELERQVPAIRKTVLKLVPHGEGEAEYLFAFRRRADVPPELQPLFLTDTDEWAVRFRTPSGTPLALLAKRVERNESAAE